MLKMFNIKYAAIRKKRGGGGGGRPITPYDIYYRFVY